MDRAALSRATDSSDSPTPGYLFLDIAKSCASSPRACNETVTYLVKRLSGTKNANIKWKCCKVISKVSTDAATRGQFKRQVCQTTDLVIAIKECIQFRGVLDPVRGDAPYERVREAAKECLSAIYSDSMEQQQQQPTSSSSNTNYSNTNYGAPPGVVSSSSSSSNKMQGIGNPMYGGLQQHQQHTDLASNIRNMTIGDVVGTVGETMKNMIKDPLARGGIHISNTDQRSAMPIPGMPGFGSGQYSHPPGRNELSDATKGQWTMASNRGPNAIGRSVPTNNSYGGNTTEINNTAKSYYQPKDASFSWAQNNSTATARGGGGVGGSWGGSTTTTGGGVAALAREGPVSNNNVPRHAPPPYTPAGNFGGTGGTALSDGSYERNLISELCPAGGMKAEPPIEKLEQFTRNLPTLNPDLICPALLDNLEDGSPWIVRAKALCVIEKTIQHNTTLDPNPYADFFHACAAEIEPLTTHSRAAIRDPARRVWKELGLELQYTNDQQPATYAPAIHATAAPAPEADLLDFGGDEPAPAVFSSSDESITQQQSNTTNTSAPPQQSSSSLFGGLVVQETTSSMQPAAADDGNFLIFTGNTPKNDTTIEATIPSPQAASASSDLFSNMSVKESVTTTSLSNTVSVAQDIADSSAGSAFSFINAVSSPAPSPVAVTKKETFDPLLSSDWSTSKPATNVNAKMQALASYQANLMMMQNIQMQQLMMQQQQKAYVIPAINPQLHHHNPSVMQVNNMRQIPIFGQDAGNANAFSFLRDDVSEKRKHEQQSFDFIKDTMKTAK